MKSFFTANRDLTITNVGGPWRVALRGGEVVPPFTMQRGDELFLLPGPLARLAGQIIIVEMQWGDDMPSVGEAMSHRSQLQALNERITALEKEMIAMTPILRNHCKQCGHSMESHLDDTGLCRIHFKHPEWQACPCEAYK